MKKKRMEKEKEEILVKKKGEAEDEGVEVGED